jgi:hypothetical protein
LSNLTSLNLDETKFALTNKVRSANVYTANGTFRLSKFSNLLSLDLSKTIFCCGAMTTGDVSSGFVTFLGSSFDKLKLLSTKGTFAVKGMTPLGAVKTARQTFERAQFPELTTLSLAEDVYAADSMTTGDKDTASYMFTESWFGKLSTLDLSAVICGNGNDGTKTIGADCFLDLENRIWTAGNKLQIVNNPSVS